MADEMLSAVWCFPALPECPEEFPTLSGSGHVTLLEEWLADEAEIFRSGNRVPQGDQRL